MPENDMKGVWREWVPLSHTVIGAVAASKMTNSPFHTLGCCRQVNELQRGLQSATEQMLAQDTTPADMAPAVRPVEGALGGHHAHETVLCSLSCTSASASASAF